MIVKITQEEFEAMYPLPMDENRASKILNSSIAKDNGLYDLGWYLAWSRNSKKACLDGDFTAEELEAIAWWMNNSDGCGAPI